MPNSVNAIPFIVVGFGAIAVGAGVRLWLRWRGLGPVRPPLKDFALSELKRTWWQHALAITVGPIALGMFVAALVVQPACLLVLVPAVLIVWAVLKFGRNFGKVPTVESIPALHPFIESPQARAAGWGATVEERLANIRRVFEEANATATVRAALVFKDQTSQGATGYSHLGFSISRNLAMMEPRHRALLRALEMLHAAGDSEWYLWCLRGLVWGDGKALIDSSTYHMWTQEKGIKDATTLVQWYMGQQDLSVEAASTMVLRKVNEFSTDPTLEGVKKELRAQLAGTGGDTGSSSAWLRPSDLSDSIFRTRGGHRLVLGQFDSGEPLEFSGDESLITIAPPGSGKTQCHVFPNLLAWKGPAVVLDVSGDIYNTTSKWRAENVGPVFRFAPLEPATSHCYSPLSFVRANADDIWEDSRLLAELMVVPSNASDPFWENEARTLLTAAIAHVCYANPPENRPMADVLDILHGGAAWDAMITGLSLAVDVRVMVQHAASLGGMTEKTRDGVRQTARSSMAAWAGERVGRVTSRSDWSPLDLRSGKNPTVYIVVKPSEVDSYLSLLRVFIGQHIRMLTGGDVPGRDAPPILFMLDELPRLKAMGPVDEALNIGRKYKLLLWMFAQSMGQMEEAYQNAQGMVGACGVRIYMNPSLQDKTAESLSEQIGYRQGPMDPTRNRIVEAATLAGPQFRDWQIVMGSSSKPARVKKLFAHADPALSERMGRAETKAVTP